MSLRAVVVGLRMGRAHARVLAQGESFDLVGVCDLDRELASAVAADLGGPAVFDDYATMLRELRPEVVAIATPTALHGEQTLLATEHGARGICCEKPMAVRLGDGRRMLAACQTAGCALIVNHQRRMQPDLLLARELVASGALGEVYRLRGQCAGDLLSDGTHALDSLLHVAGDLDAEWVFGQVHRRFGPSPLPGHTAPGVRFGHLVEAGCLAVVQLVGGPRIELLCGDLREPGRIYQDYEIEGTRGRLWRTGDSDDPSLFIADGQPGDHAAGRVDGRLVPQPAPGGPWRAVTGAIPRGGMPAAYAALAETIATGAPHPLTGENSLRGLEILCAVAESARRRERVPLPFDGDGWPLEELIAEGAWPEPTPPPR